MTITQHDPRVIIGTQAELANFVPSRMPGGTFYFARDAGLNGTMYVLDITPLGVRSWKPIGGGSSGWPPYVVSKGDPVAPYNTIQDAIDAAVANGHDDTNPAVVLVHPGVYGEDITAYRGIHLAAFTTEQTLSTAILGSINLPAYVGPPTPGTTFQIVGFDLRATSGPFLTVVADETTLVAVQNCVYNSQLSFAHMTSANPNSSITFKECSVDVGFGPEANKSVVSLSGTSLTVQECTFSANSAAGGSRIFTVVGNADRLNPEATIVDSNFNGTCMIAVQTQLRAIRSRWSSGEDGFCIDALMLDSDILFDTVSFVDVPDFVIRRDVQSTISISSRCCSINNDARLTNLPVGSTGRNRDMTARVFTSFNGVMSNVIDLVACGGIPLSLPEIGAIQDGERITVTSSGATTISPSGADTIDGGASYPIVAGGIVEFQADNGSSDWKVTSKYTGMAPRTARFIVGNQTAGDTLDVCDFLDPGDGTGILAALTAATGAARGDVFVRSGVYTLNYNTISTPYTVPPGVTVRGAGRETVIIGTQTERQLFVLDSATLKDLSIQMPEAAPTGIIPVQGDLVVRFTGTSSVAENVSVLIQGGVNPLETLTGVFGTRLVALTQQAQCMDCTVSGPGRIKAPDIQSALVAAFSFESAPSCTVRGRATGMDVLLRLSGPLAQSERGIAVVEGRCYKTGIIEGNGHHVTILNTTDIQPLEIDPLGLIIGESTDCIFDMILSNANSTVSTLVLCGATCDRNTFRLTLSSADTGMNINGVRNMIVGSVVHNIATDGFLLNATADRNTISLSTIEAPTPINIAGATNTIAVNNQ